MTNVTYWIDYVDSCPVEYLTDHYNRPNMLLLAIDDSQFSVEYSVNDQIGEEFTKTQIAEIVEKIKLAVSKLSNPDGSSLIGEDGFHWFLLTWEEVYDCHDEWEKEHYEFYEEEHGGF